MSKKIFVSYKHSDYSVRQAPNTSLITTARDYVNHLETLIDATDQIYKGERDGEDLSKFKDETIASKLRDKIYDSTITIVMLSKNMVEPKPEEDQWIPWEIEYSLREKNRDGRISHCNAVLAVVIPDENSSYEYFIQSGYCISCKPQTFMTNATFDIIGKNMFNHKNPTLANCSVHVGPTSYIGYHSYIHVVKWDDFASNIYTPLETALYINSKIDDYHITKRT